MNDLDRLPPRVLFGYGLSSAPVMFAYVLVLLMYMKFAVDSLGADPAVVGTIFLAAKLWDAVSDPMVGSWSDRTARASGRRRPWILASAPLLAIFGVMAWAPPADLSPNALTIWITIAIFGFYTAYTVFEVPHMALGAEITLDSDDRNRAFGTRQLMRILGMFSAGTLGVYLVSQGVESAAILAYGVAAATLILIWSGLSFLPRERASFQGRGGANPYHAIRDVLANRHARLLLLVIFIDGIGAGGIGSLTPFAVEYVLKMEGLAPVLLGLNMLAALAGIPIWIRLARRFEKRRLILVSLFGSSIGYGSIVMVGEGDWFLFGCSSVIAGFSSTCMNTLGYSLKSEIIDCDEHATGERKEGVYFAGWAFVSKLATGIMIGIVGFALSWSGFVANQPDQTDLVKQTMLLLMGGMPLVCFFVGALLFTRFDLTEQDHARIRAELDARETAQAD